MKLLAKDIDPQTICRTIRLCPHVQEQQSEVVASEVAKVGDNCALCKLIVQQVEAQLLQNKTEEQIIDFLTNDVCPLFGSLQPEVRFSLDFRLCW